MQSDGYIPYEWTKAIGIANTPDDDVDRLILRQSDVANATLCNGRVYLARELAVELPPSEAMFFGTLMHGLIEQFIEDYTAHEDLDWISDPDRVRHIAHALWQDEVWTVELADAFYSPTAYKAWISEAMMLLSSWVEGWFLNNVDLIADTVVSEEILWIMLGVDPTFGTEVWLRGTPDLATPWLLVDWKTSGRAWAKGKALGSMQDDVYAGLLRHNYELRIENALFVVGNRASRKWEEHPTRVTEASIEAAMFRAWQVGQMLLFDSPTYTPTTSFGQRSWHCRPQYCSVWDQCQAKALGDTFDAQPQEVRSRWR